MTTTQANYITHAMQCVEQIYGVPADEIRGKRRTETIVMARCAAVLLTHEVHAIPAAVIAEATHRTRDGINRSLRAARTLRTTSRRWREQYHTAVALMGQGRSVCACCMGQGVAVCGGGLPPVVVGNT